jgi:hypothetical protein
VESARGLGPRRLDELKASERGIVGGFLGLVIGEAADETAHIILGQKLAAQIANKLSGENRQEWSSTTVIELVKYCRGRVVEIGKGWDDLSEIEDEIVNVPF